MAKIKVTQYGIIHVASFCENCNWSSDKSTREDVRADVRRHVRATGHTVSVETGNSTSYSLETEK
jgi:hypothetical protein